MTITPPSDMGGAQNYGSAFLPAIYQGTRIGSYNRPISRAGVSNLNRKLDAMAQRDVIDFAQMLNHADLEREQYSPEVEGVIESYELAYKMQSEMPEVMDISRESAATKKLYGIDDASKRTGGIDAGTDDFGRKCLLARRMVEAGVRFVEIAHGNWDQHFNLETALTANAHAVDLPIAGLLTDLQSRGMLKDTLVIWAGEFGRSPHAQGGDGARSQCEGFYYLDGRGRSSGRNELWNDG